MKKAIVFDFDGTLADTLPLVIFCFKEVFRLYTGTEYTDDEIVGMFGPTEEVMLERLIPEPDLGKANTLFFELYQLHHTRLVEEHTFVSQMIDTLHQAGYRLGIYTGKGRRSLDISRDFLPFCNLFEVILTGDDVQRAKPDPEGIIYCLSHLDVTPDSALYIGDSNSDVVAGHAAGVTTIGAQWMPNTQSKGFNTDPDRVFEDTESFLTWLRRLNRSQLNG